MTHRIEAVECFMPGRWNDGEYDAAGLRWLCAAARFLGGRVPVRDRHKGPEIGTAEHIRFDEARGRLLADLIVPEPVVRRMQAGDCRKVSVELAWNRELGCETLTGVALYAADEAVSVEGLAPIPVPAEDADVAVGGTA